MYKCTLLFAHVVIGIALASLRVMPESSSSSLNSLLCFGLILFDCSVMFHRTPFERRIEHPGAQARARAMNAAMVVVTNLSTKYMCSRSWRESGEPKHNNSAIPFLLFIAENLHDGQSREEGDAPKQKAATTAHGLKSKQISRASENSHALLVGNSQKFKRFITEAS